LLLVGLTACTVGPDYRRPAAPVPSTFKSLRGWTIAQPMDATNRGAWWAIFHDPVLDRLEREVDVSNQTIKQALAAYSTAVALVREAQAGFFPTAGLSAGVTRGPGFGGGGRGSSGTGTSSIGGAGTSSTSGAGTSSTGGGGGGRSVGGAPITQYSIEGSIDWTPDVWGRIRRQVESQTAAAQVSAADLANARLSAQMTLAVDYFDMRAEDSLTDLLRQTVAADAAAYRIVHNQYLAGITALSSDVTARAQLESARAELIGVGVQRAIFEHAIAVLTGRPPAELTLSPAPMTNRIPVVPPGLPSTLLQRRPDIAAAERQMQEENALIGVQVAAFYPDISLSVLGGFIGSPLSQLFTTANRVWSLGASAGETVFAGGARSAAVAAARATYDESVANYRQVVLTAFQQVEDQLISLRILAEQARAEDTAVRATKRAVDVLFNQYMAGTVAYTNVVTEQTALLTAQQSALAVQQSRLVASVTLITALGGGWSTGALPQANRIGDKWGFLRP
jgi:NodT family efflux transporter outer membrane factor (OMF) lipoprotein